MTVSEVEIKKRWMKLVLAGSHPVLFGLRGDDFIELYLDAAHRYAVTAAFNIYRESEPFSIGVYADLDMAFDMFDIFIVDKEQICATFSVNADITFNEVDDIWCRQHEVSPFRVIIL